MGAIPGRRSLHRGKGAFPAPLAHHMGKQRARHNGSEQRPCRRCQAHGIEGIREAHRSQIRPGNADAQRSGEVPQERDEGSAVGAEIAAEAEIDACKNAVGHVGAQLLCAHADDLGVAVGEQGDDLFGNDLADSNRRKTEAYTDGHAVAKHLEALVMAARADVLRREGGH